MLQTDTKNTITAFEMLAKELQEGVRAHEVKDAELAQYLDCEGCGKID